MNEKLLEYFKSDDIHLVQCEHKWCNAYGYEKSQMKKDLIDYITNLQQENEELNRMCELYRNSLYNAELSDYKSRFEKANEWIDKHQQIIENMRKEKFYILNLGVDDLKEFKNILNGSDENETNS